MHNQTEQPYMHHALSGEQGVGIFVIPDLNSDEQDPVTVVEVSDIDYLRCVKRGSRTLAFKWIPAMEYAKITATQCGGPCASGCSHNCVCWLGNCISATNPIVKDPPTSYDQVTEQTD